MFPDEAARRVAVRCVVRLAGGALLLFCVVDDHVHVVVSVAAGRVRVLGGAILRGLRAIARCPVEPVHARPVERRSHFVWLVEYTLDQTAHHGIDVPAALWSGSCFQDLVGARAIGLSDTRIREALPRLSRADFFRMAGSPIVEPAGDELVRRVGASRIVAAASAAVAADPRLLGRTAPVVLARKVAATLATGAGVARTDTAWALGLTRRGVHKLDTSPVDSSIVHAARMQLAIEEAVTVGSRARTG